MMNNIFKYHTHLGFFNPYFLKLSDKLEINEDFNQIIKYSAKNLDTTAAAQILKFGFSLGNRTLLTDISKTPWMAKPNSSNNGWDYFKVPSHEENIIDNESLIEEFFNKLKKELLEYIKGKTNIGFLLTGGMDSRIVASVLSNVIKDNKLDITVSAFTWGHPQSRDVVYAKRIAEIYNWKWEHLIIDADQLKRNIELTIENACEFSPIHLHAMPKVFDKENLECVLAGSFGDSVGRGEYSGVKVANIKPLHSGMNNSLSLLNNKIFEEAVDETLKDVEEYHKLFPQQKEYQQLEQDYQLHYMRRMLNPCMNIINKKTPVYQMFSSPEVFGFMWSLHPSLRTDKVYHDILKTYSPELLEIPWARTGLPFPQTEGVPDKFNNKTIDYGVLIRDNFMEDIENCLLNGSLIKSNILSIKKVRRLIKLIKTKPIKDSYFFEDKLIWLYTLQLFIDRNGIKTGNYKSTNFSNDNALIKEYYMRLYFYKYRKTLKRMFR